MTDSTETELQNQAEECDAIAEPTPIDIAAITMHGDLVSALIDELKAAPDVWQKLSEDKQAYVIDRVRRRVGDAIEQAVRAIAAEGRETCVAQIDQLVSKDGIKVQLKVAGNDPQRHTLLDSVGKEVLIVVADSRQFMGGKAPEAEPNQPTLDGLEDGAPVADSCPATAEE